MNASDISKSVRKWIIFMSKGKKNPFDVTKANDESTQVFNKEKKGTQCLVTHLTKELQNRDYSNQHGLNV